MSIIVVEARGGNVVAVYSNLSDASVVLVDWDNIQAGDTAGELPGVPLDVMPEDTRGEYARALGLSQ